MRTTWILLLAVLIAPVASGQSLFKKDQQTVLLPQPQRRPLQTLINDLTPEKKIWRKHDLVTILVIENTQSSIQTNTIVRKETELDIELKKFIRLKKKKGGGLFGYDVLNAQLPTPAPAIEFEAEYERLGLGRARRKFTLKAAITAEVIKVLPNGNLVIEARKTRQVDDDKELMVLTGVIRPQDISKKTNTILSQKIARLTYKYIGEGTTYNAQKPGLISRVVEFLWPF